MQSQRQDTMATTAVVGLFTALIWVVPALAVDVLDDPVQIDERAAQLVQTSNSLCWELSRYHQQQPNYAETYRAAKEIWSQAGQMREALRNGPMETEALQQQLTEIQALFAQVDSTASKWGSGDRSLVASNPAPTQRVVERPGVDVEIPFIGVRVGGPQVVVTDAIPSQLERKRLHPNSHGSKRSLERELAAVKMSLGYFLEDAGMIASPNLSATGAVPVNTPATQPPAPDATLQNSPQTVPSAKKTNTTPDRK